jgi:hypothetical protein
MAGSGSEKRQRNIICSVRFTTTEYALVCVNADQASLTVASYLRAAGAKLQLPPAGHCPSIDRQMTSQLMAVMGEAATAFRDAAHLVDPDLAETTMNNINEYRIVLFESMGRAP